MIPTRSVLRTINRAAERALAALGPPPRLDARRPMAHVRRLLVAKLVGMGDAVLVRSLVERLMHTHPEIEIGALAGPATREVLETIPRVRLHTYDPAGGDFGLARAAAKVREIRAAGYDAVIDFEQHLVLVAAFLSLTGIRTRIGLASTDSPRGRFQTHTVTLVGNEPMWQAYLDLVQVLAGPLPNPSAVPLPVSAAVAADVAAWWKDNGLDRAMRPVAFHMGCGSTAVARRWPVARFVRLAEELLAAGYADRFLLTGTAGESGLADDFACALSGRTTCALGLPSLQHTAEVLRRSVLVVSNDTGVMHLAAAMGTPTVGLFGPNSPARYAPVGPRTLAVYRTHAACSPCIHIHRGVVPECSNDVRGRCLLDIQVPHVMEAVHMVMAADLCAREVSPGAYAC